MEIDSRFKQRHPNLTGIRGLLRHCFQWYINGLTSFFSTLPRYLAVVAGVISEADYVFIPESPPPVDWEAKLCTKLEQARTLSSVLGNEECDLTLVLLC